jgi:hypothetical protein
MVDPEKKRILKQIYILEFFKKTTFFNIPMILLGENISILIKFINFEYKNPIKF